MADSYIISRVEKYCTASTAWHGFDAIKTRYENIATRTMLFSQGHGSLNDSSFLSP
jgi:hypothetical protein